MSASLSVRSITPLAAHRAVGAAMARAEREGLAIVACVVDSGGRTIAHLRMTDAPFHSNGIAKDKAFTAASFRMPTEELGARLAHDAVLRDGIAQRRRTILFGGGLPIMEQGHVIGAIGVSGASEEQDRLIAQAGIEAIEPGAPPEKHLPAGESA
nr:heme-binding protein [Sphingomonas sp. CDS-1]